MKNKAPLFLLIMSTIFASVGVIGGSLAWFSYKAEVQNEENPIMGSVQDEYYASGSGAVDDPYIINKPRHLYNLAWLQYLGFYNKSSGADDHQFYFKLGANVDMGEFGPIPPIGTEDNPFVGNFDGDGYAVSNVTISNDFSDYKAHPSIIDGWDETKDYNQPHILGFFGVIGDYAGAIKPTDYSSAANAFVNTALTGVTVRTETADSLMGIAAGYVNVNNLSSDAATGNKSAPKTKNIIVDDSTLVLPESGATTSYGDYTENISDYTLVGYTNDTSGIVKASKSINGVNAETNINFPAPLTGDATGFGGSIGMNELYTRINTFRTNSATTSIPAIKTSEYNYANNPSKSYDINTNFNSSEYYNNDLTGRVVYGQTATNYLWGTRTHEYTYRVYNEGGTTGTICYYAKATNNNTTYYLRFTGGNASATTTESNKTILFTDSSGWVYYEYGGSNYYLYASSDSTTTLGSTTNSSSRRFKISGSALRLYKNSSAQNKYVLYDGGFKIGNSSSNILTQIRIQSSETRSYVTNGTYLPLNVYKASDSEKMAADQAKLNELYGEDKAETLIVNGAKYNNTGYIIGGTKDISDDYGSAVRVASNYDYGDIYRAFGRNSDQGSQARYSAADLQVITHTKDSNGPVFISDKYNSEKSLSTYLTGLNYIKDSTKYTPEELGLNAYNSARDNLDTQFNASQSTMHVLRFNEYQIDINKKIEAEKVLLNGELKTNYEFPESCIDFNLKQKGYISFFGGSFRGASTANTFFCLYHIERDEDDKIVSLKHLNKIYGTDNSKDSYIYEYVDDTNGALSYSIYDKKQGKYVASGAPTDPPYKLHFDMKWVEEPGFETRDYTFWYLEIPVNEGEYALGAVKGRTGVYMMYLDVGTNASQATRTVFYEKFVYNEQSFRFPTGVSLKSITITEGSSAAVIAETTIVIDDSDSATMIVLAGATGDYSMDRADNAVSIDRSDTNKAPPTYASDLITLKDETGQTISPTGNASSSYEIHQMTYYDYIPTNNSLMVTTFTDYYDVGENFSLTFEKRMIAQSTYANTSLVPSDTSSVTPVVYDSSNSSTSANLNSIHVYNPDGGGEYANDVITSPTNLVIDSAKLSTELILEYRVFEEGTETYTDSTNLVAIIDTSLSEGTYNYYEFNGYVIVLTPDGEGTVTVAISTYNDSYTMKTWDYYTGTNTTATIAFDGTTIKITINDVTVTGVNQTIPESTNP